MTDLHLPYCQCYSDGCRCVRSASMRKTPVGSTSPPGLSSLSCECIPDDNAATETHGRSLTNPQHLHKGRVPFVRAAVAILTSEVVQELTSRQCGTSNAKGIALTRHPCHHSESVRASLF